LVNDLCTNATRIDERADRRAISKGSESNRGRAALVSGGRYPVSDDVDDDCFFFSCFNFFFSLVLRFAAFCFSFLPLSLLPLSPIAMSSVLGISSFWIGRRPLSSSNQPRKSARADGILNCTSMRFLNR
jgi:hypothetical protein